MINIKDNDIDIVAKTIYGEARGEYKNYGENSLIAIANVIQNRKNITGEPIFANICLKPKQFSCWNNTDPNKKIIENVTVEDQIFLKCLKIATHAINKNLEDITNGATHYYSTFLKNPPYWAKNKKPTAIIGNHIFLITN